MERKRPPAGAALNGMVNKLLGPGDHDPKERRLAEITIISRPEYGLTQVQLSGLSLEQRTLLKLLDTQTTARKLAHYAALEKALNAADAPRDDEDIDPPPAPE